MSLDPLAIDTDVEVKFARLDMRCNVCHTEGHFTCELGDVADRAGDWASTHLEPEVLLASVYDTRTGRLVGWWKPA